MAEQKRASAPEPAGAAPAPSRKRFPLKTLMVLAAVLLLEGTAISAAFLLAGKPADVRASDDAAMKAMEAEKLVEELVIADKFQNTRSGRTYLYDTEIYVVIRKKNQVMVKDQVKQMTAKITADVAIIFRQSEPSHLLEPTLATLTRQIKVALEGTLGMDADGEPLIQEVLIKKYTQYRSDI